MALDDLQDDVDQFMSGRRGAGKSTPKQASDATGNDVDSFMFKRRAPERQPYGPPRLPDGPEVPAWALPGAKSTPPPANSPSVLDFRAPTEAEKAVDRAMIATGDTAPPPQATYIRTPRRGRVSAGIFDRRPVEQPSLVERQQTQQAVNASLPSFAEPQIVTKEDRTAASNQFLDGLARDKQAREVASRAAAEEEKKRAPGGVHEVFNRFVRGATDVSTSTIKGIGALSGPVAAEAGERGMRPVDEAAKEYFPVDPTRKGSANPFNSDFWTVSLPQGAGSMVPFALSGGLAGRIGIAPRLAAAMLGASSNASQTYDAAKASGADENRARLAAAIGALIGTTEAAGSSGSVGETVTGGLRKLLTEIGEEGGQEAAQQLLDNINAKVVSGFDPHRAISDGVLESGVVGAVLGGGMAAPHLALEARTNRQEGARTVASEPLAPMNLIPTVPEGTQTDVQKITPKPVDLASQKAQQANQQAGQPGATAAQPGQPVQSAQPGQPVAQPAAAPELLFPGAQAPAARDLSGLSGADRIAALMENVRLAKEGRANTTVEQQVNKDYGDASGLLSAAEANWDADRPTAELHLNEGIKKLKGSLQNLQNSPGYQAELTAAAQGRQLPATPYTSAVQAINQRLARADALINRDAEIERQQKEAEKLQRKNEKEQAKAARIQTREELQRQREIAVEERKAQLAAERSAAAEVRRQKQEAAKTARRAELEKMRANAQNEKQAKLAEAELQRMASHDAALKAADDAGQRSQKFHAEGRTAEAVNELVVQQNQIRDAVKFLPRTPEAQNTKADLNRYFGQVGNRIGDLRREARGVRGPVTEAIPPLMRPDAAVNPEGGVPPAQSFYTPGAGFERLAAGQKEASDEQRPLLTAIRQMGGISDDGDTSGELRRLGVRESGTTGIVNNRTGLSPDEMRAQLAEDGYLSPDSTVDDLYQAIEGEMRSGQKSGREAESISDFYDRFAEAGRQGDGETRPSFDDIAAEVEAEQEQPSEEELDQAAYRRALDRSVQNRGERVAPGEPGKGKSLSGFNTMLSRHAEKIDRLREMNLNSPEAKQIIEEIRADNEKMAIEYNRRHLTPHLDELLTMIMSDQFTALAEQDRDLREQIIEEARALPVVERTEVEREVAAVDVVFDDEDMRNLLARAVEGDDNATSDFIELATDYYGLNEETTTDLIRNRRADRARQQAEVRRAAQPRTQNRVSAPNAEENQGPKSQQLTDRERQLLNLKPDDIFDDRFDDYMAKIEDIHARAVRGELDIDPQTIQDSARWVGLSPEEVEQRRAAGERAPILNRIHAARSARVEENRLPARENLETINKYMHADLLSLAAPSKSNRMSRLDEVINAARITVEKKPTGMSAAKLAEVNDLLQRALSARAEYLATKSDEVRTVSHSNPAIDGKEIIRETDDGKVIVANPDNKTGISVVKDQSAESSADSTGDTPYEFSSTQVNLSGSIAEKIAEFAKRIPDADLADDGREDQPHITVKYGLHGDSADEVRAVLSGEKPIKVTFGKVSLFQTNDDYDVVKVDVDSPDLHRLNKKIAELPHTDTFPDYKPHATIAYVKKGKGEKYAGNRFLNGQVARLSSLVFSDKNRQQVEIQLDGKTANASTQEAIDTGSTIPAEATNETDRSVGTNQGDLFGDRGPEGVPATDSVRQTGRGSQSSSRSGGATIERPARRRGRPAISEGARDVGIENALFDRQSGEDAGSDAAAPAPEPQIGIDKADPSRTESQPPSAAARPSDYHITDLESVTPSGKLTKLRANLDAIRLLRDLQADGRTPTTEEQRQLAQFIGWGQFPDLFNDINEAGKKLDAERAELKELLSPEEYERARRSTLNAQIQKKIEALFEAKKAPAAETDVTEEGGIVGAVKDFLKEEGGSASLGLGIPQIASRLFNQPKTTPLRAILEDHKPLIVDPFKIQDQTLDAIYKAGTEGTLPGARALYWADKLKAKKISDKVANFQANFIESMLDKTNKLIEASEAMAQAARGGREYEAAKKKIERLNLQIANAISRMGEYTHPAAYAAKAYKTNLLSAPHIHLFNVLEQIFKFPLHEAQRAIDFMVPTKTFQKWGIPYEKGITDFRDLVPAIETELRGLATGLARSPRDIADMLYYGVTRQMQRMDAAENDHAGGTDKFELGHRAKMIPGLDQVINFIGRTHGAADIAFGNMVNASLIGAQANAQARKIGKKMGFTEKGIRDLARDLANEPSAAIVTLASDATERFKLDYPTLAYDALQALRNLPVEKVGGRHLGEAYKAALDFVVPFSKIPLAAVDTYLFRYSPVGLARTAGRLVTANSRKGTDKPATGRYTGEMAAQRHAEDTAELFRQGAIGTISWALMGALASFGYIKFQGGREDDDDRRNVSNVKEILGQDYKQEMVAGDRAYNLHRMGPLGEATAIGSRMYQAGQPRRNPLTGEPEDVFKRAGRVAKAGKDAIIFNNPLGNAAKDIAGDDSHSSMIGNFIGNKTRGLVPGALRDVAKVKNPTKVVPDDSSLGARLKAGVQSGMPFDAGFGKRADMAPRLDAMGNPVEEPNPFQFSRPVKHDPQMEEMLKLGVGVGKPKRDGGTPAAEYNDQIRARAAETRTALDRIAADTEQAGRSDVAKARIYSRELSPAAMERAAKLSDGTIDIERSIEALRADAYEALRADQAYQRMSDRQKLEARKRIDDQLKSYRGRAASSRSREKAASAPGYSPQDLARTALGNVP